MFSHFTQQSLHASQVQTIGSHLHFGSFEHAPSSTALQKQLPQKNI
jgi:hypothetical protein